MYPVLRKEFQANKSIKDQLDALKIGNRNNFRDVSGPKVVGKIILDKEKRVDDKITEIQINNEEHLDLSHLELTKIPKKITTIATQLKSLKLKNNKLENIDLLSDLINLVYLDISHNIIHDLRPISKLNKLKELRLENNKVNKISYVSMLSKLEHLDISDNSITMDTLIKDNRIQNYFELNKEKLNLKISLNPFLKEIEGINIRDYPHIEEANHMMSLVEDFGKIFGGEDDLISQIVPQKLVILGNSNSGKTSLVKFLINDKLQIDSSETPLSTDMLKIIEWKNPGENSPEFLIYDFGGQDYYHATYQMFFSEEASYLLLWSKDNNVNMHFKGDGKLRTKPYYCFDMNYWLGNIKYLNDTVNNRVKDDNENISWYRNLIIVENKIDTDFESSFNLDSDIQFGEIESFKISLKSQEEVDVIRRDWLRKYLLHLNPHKTKEFRSRVNAINDFLRDLNEIKTKNEWIYSNLMEYLSKKFSSWKKLDSNEKERILFRLSTTGLILWYRYDKDLKHRVWLDPIKVQEQVLEFINQKIIKKYKGIIYAYALKNNQIFASLKNLLIKQQIIFYDEYYRNSKSPVYIIPQNLIDNLNDNPLFQIATNGLKNAFCVKFFNFMPMGIMNRIISMVGNLPDLKYYSRFQIVFTLNQEKFLLICTVDDLSLQIKSNSKNENLYKEIFLRIIAAYHRIKIEVDWDSNGTSQLDLNLQSKLFKVIPEDLLLSVHDNEFVNYKSLVFARKNNLHLVNGVRKHQTSQQIHGYKFNAFMKEKFTRPKSIFISYSHDDLEYRKKLQQYLRNMERENLISIWQDGLIEPGTIWDTEIKNNLNNADIIIFLISQSLISSTYSNEVELRTSLSNLTHKKSLILPVLIKNCDYKNWKAFPTEITEELVQNETSISNFQFLPNSTEEQRLLPINKWVFQEDAWVQIIDKIRSVLIVEE